jgi:radical SAM protein with 4Fe4S-binding SPASM domain
MDKFDMKDFEFTKDECQKVIDKFKGAIKDIKEYKFEPIEAKQRKKSKTCQYCQYKDFCNLEVV